MKLMISNISCKLLACTPKEMQWLDAYLSFRSTGLGGSEKAQSLYDVLNKSFPTGLLNMVLKQAIVDRVHIECIDGRRCPIDPSRIDFEAAELGYLRPYQKEALKAAIESGRGILELFTGAGKCLAKGTKVIGFGGNLVNVEDVKNGDLLLGPDSKPRKVTGICSGIGPLFKIIPHKGDSWICNSVHVLSLVHTQTAEVVDVPLSEYLLWPSSKKHYYKLFQPECIDFSCSSQLPIDPYFIGIWLGDGRKDPSKGIEISKPDAEIKAACELVANDWGLMVSTYDYGKCPTYRLKRKPAISTNRLLLAMQKLFTSAVCIPHIYKTASVLDRLQLLAGLIDTDGHLGHGYYEISQKSETLIHDIAFLARSLGFKVVVTEKRVNGTVYFRANILGDISRIPCKVLRKIAPPRKINKNALRTGFKVESAGVGEFFGFSLDADHRFLLGDFTVNHNTEIAIGLHLALTQQRPLRTLMIVTAQNLLHQTAQRYHERVGKVAGVIGDGACCIEDFTVGTFQSLHALLKKNAIDLAQFDVVLMDECHTTAASTYWEITKKLTQCYYRIALSATALKRADRKDLYTVAATGDVLYKLSIRDGVELNAVAPPSVYIKRYTHQDIYPYAFGDVYKHAIAESRDRNLAGVQLIQTAKKPTIAFVKHTNHGQYLMKLLSTVAPDLRCVFVHGKAKKALTEAKQLIEQNGLDVIVSTDVLATGTDIPEIMSLVNLAGMKAEIGVIQKVGRAARKYKDGQDIKSSFEVFDLLDIGTDPEHQSHKWLMEHADDRLASYRSLGFGVNIL